jgi:hypothetical protein
VVERRGGEAAPLDDLGAAAAASCPARLALEVGQRVVDRRCVALGQQAGRRRIAEREGEADALGRVERQVEPGHRTIVHRPAQQCAHRRVLSRKQAHRLAALDLAVEAERDGSSAEPAARSFALAGVVVLAPEREGVFVVTAGVRPRGELADGQHQDAPERTATLPCRASGPNTPLRVAGNGG